MKKILLCVIPLLLMASCRSSRIASKNLTGIVSENNGEACQGAEIYIDEKYICSTDLYGHFTLADDIPQKTILTSKKKGFFNSSVLLEGSGKNRMVYITMESIAKEFEKAVMDVQNNDYEEALKKIHRIEAEKLNDCEKKSLLTLYGIIYKKENKVAELENCLDQLENLHCYEEVINKLKSN